jgi:lactate dehydrogenase-like 2-hydroxyacid dehydrogenase
VLEALDRRAFVNVARGSVVDEMALVELLTARQLGGAGLDVACSRAQGAGALLTLDHVALQPHQASA